MIDLLPETFYIKDLDSRFLVANETLAKLLGKDTPSQVIGLSDTDFYPAGLAAGFRAEELKVFAGEPLIGRENTMVSPDGREHTVLTTKLPFRDSQGRICGLVGIGHDITERRQAEEIIAQERHLLRTLIDQLPETIYIKDLDSRFLVANEALAKQWGKASPAELLGRSDTDLFPAEKAAVYRAEELKVFAGEPLIGRERIGVFADGTQHTLLTTKVPFRDSQGKICGLVGIVHDITERKRAEEATARERHLLRTLIDLLPETFYVKDLDGRFLVVNDALAKQWGKAGPAELLGLTDTDLFPAETAAEYRAEELKVFAGEPVVGRESICVFADGRKRTMLTTKLPFRDSQGKICGLVGLGYDITERKRVEAALRESEERYQQIARCTPDLIWTMDLSGRFTYANPAVERTHGWTVEEFQKLTFRETSTPEYAAKKAAMIGEELARAASPQFDRNTMRTFESEELRKDGSTFWAEVSATFLWSDDGKPAGIIGVARDITERKRAEKEFIRTAKEWQTTFDATKDAIWILDPNHRVLRSNKTAEGFFKRTCCEMIGKPCWEIVHGTNEPIPECPFVRSRQSGRRETMELQQDEHWFEVIVDPILDAAGQYAGAVHIVSDITERKQVEQALKESEVRYHRISAAITDYIYNVRVADGRAVKTTHSPGCLAITGYQPKEFAHDPYLWFRMVAAEDRPKVEEQARQILAGQDPPPIEHRIIRKNGTERWVRNTFVPHRDKRGALVAYDGLIQDITERRRAEQALQESEKKYRVLIETTTTGFVIVDAKGRVLDANDEYVRLSGHEKREQIVGRSVTEWTAAHDRERNAREVKKCIASGSVRGLEVDYVHPDGTVVPIEINASTLGAGDDLKIMTLCRNITERKRTEEALRESEVRYRTLFDKSADGILIADVETRKFKYANPVVCRMLGYTEEEMRTLGVPDIHPKEAMPRIAAEFEAQARGDKTLAADIPCLRKDGSVVHADINAVKMTVDGRPCNVGFFRDITERKRADLALEETRRMLRLVLDTIPVRVFWKDLAGRYLGCNRPFARDASFDSPDELTGKNDHDMGWKDQAELYRADDQRVIASGDFKASVRGTPNHTGREAIVAAHEQDPFA